MNLANNAGLYPFHRLAERTEYTPQTLKLFTRFLGAGASIEVDYPNSRSLFHRFLAVSGDMYVSKSASFPHYAMSELLRNFLKKGADPLTLLPSGKPLACDVAQPLYAKTPWHLDSLLGKLIFRKVPLGPVMSNGNTVLHEICMQCVSMTSGRGYPSLPGIETWIELLLKRGANPNLFNNMGQSPFALLFNHEGNYRSVIEKVIPAMLKYGGNLTLLDENDRPILFDAVAKIDSSNALKPLVQSTIQKLETMNVPIIEDSSPWLHHWHHGVKAESWEAARDFVLRSKDLVPANIEEKIRLNALTALAENHIKRLKSLFGEDEDAKAKRRKCLAVILRDCREEGIETEKAHIDYLLELCI